MSDYKELISQCEEWLEITNKTNCSDLHEFVSEVKDYIEQLVKERDAAVNDLERNCECTICKHYTKESIRSYRSIKMHKNSNCS